jgi:hypothetical protein
MVARIASAEAPPPRAALTPDEWTSDAPAFPRPSHARLTPSAPPSAPLALPAPDAKTPPPALTQPAALALAQDPAKDDAKICKTPQPHLEIAAAPPLRLSYSPRLSGKVLDIAPQSPPPEQERQVRLSALLAEALQQ